MIRFSMYARSLWVAIALSVFSASPVSATYYGGGWHDGGSGYVPVDQAVPISTAVGGSVLLDPSDAFSLSGSGPFLYEWSLLERPSGSLAELNDPELLRPQLQIDVAGDYLAELTIRRERNRHGWSGWRHHWHRHSPNRYEVVQKVQVRVSTDNVPPVARAMLLGMPKTGDAVVLDGSGSFDGDGDGLTYQWSVTDAPHDSQIADQIAAQQGAPRLSLEPDREGSYRLSLTVTDARGLVSEAKSLSFNTWKGTAPVASALWEQIDGVAGSPLVLDAFESTDADGQRLSATWKLIYAPEDSAATLIGREDRRVALTPDMAGDYLVQLTVRDRKGKTSTDHVLVVVGDGAGGLPANIRPVARIADLPAAVVDAGLTLDGTQTYDLNGDLLSYSWSVLRGPADSIAAVIADGPQTGFTPDRAGDYVLQLIATDGAQASLPATVHVVIDAPLPVADAGPDALDADGTATLDGTGSVAPDGGPLGYSWAVLGLNGLASDFAATLSDVSIATPDLTLGQRTDLFKNVVVDDTVYENRGDHGSGGWGHGGWGHGGWGNGGWGQNHQAGQGGLDENGLCRFDVRQSPPLAAGEEPNHPRRPNLYARGLVWTDDGADLQVWTIRNRRGLNHQIRLEASDGSWSRDLDLSGGVNATLSAPHVPGVKVKFFVDGVYKGRYWGRHHGFHRHEQVCAGPAATVAQLTVTSPSGPSVPDTVVIGDINMRPVAARGAPVTAGAGAETTLMAQAFASDVNPDDTLTYAWSLLYRPDGSNAEIADGPRAPGETVAFTPDLQGQYLVQLTASDGDLLSVPAVVVVEVTNAPPIADAGPDQTAFVGDVATLDGSASSDPDGDALQFTWTVIDRPAGSTAQVAGGDTATPTFSPDRRGDYVLQLVVSDGAGSSAPDFVTVTAPNRAPTAVLAPAPDGYVDEVLRLDAAASSDPDDDPLVYAWEVVSAPAGSTLDLSAETGPVLNLVPDQPGDYTVRVTANDGLATASAEDSFSVIKRNIPPVLDPIEDQTVTAGETLTLQLVGTDEDGEPLTYFARPLPLPVGMTLDGDTGVLTFTPTADQVGAINLSIGVSDAIDTDEQGLLITVVLPDPTAPTAISGQVLDAEDFAQGVITPIPNAAISLREGSETATSGADGSFSITTAGSGRDTILVVPDNQGPGGYSTESRLIDIAANVTSALQPPFLLSRVGQDCVNIDPAVETVLSSATLGVTLTFPAGSVQDENGAAYTGQVCLGAAPRQSQPPQMPDEINACQIYSVNAPGAVFSERVGVSAPNLDGLPAGAGAMLYELSTNAARFIANGDATVSADGTTLTLPSGGLSSPSQFTIIPLSPMVTTSPDQPDGISVTSPAVGDYQYSYTMANYRVFNERKGITIAYHSRAADPTGIVAADVTIADTAGLPVTVSGDLEIGGVSFDGMVNWDPRSGADGSTPALFGESVTLRNASTVDLTGFESGRYAYRYTTQAMYDCSTVGTVSTGELHIHNETESPIGDGWSIDDLQRIVENPDGTVAIVENGRITPFDPEPTFSAFGEQLRFPSEGVNDLALGDFDGNGEIDIAHPINGRGTIGLIYNFGERDFRQDLELPFGDPVTDIQEQIDTRNGVWTPDITAAVATKFPFRTIPGLTSGTNLSARLGLLINNGFGDYNEFFYFDGGLNFVSDIAVGNLDGEGDDTADDVVAIMRFNGPQQRIFVGFIAASGAGQNAFAFTQNTAENYLQAIAVDLDSDGFDDILFRNRFGARILWNDGDRTFTTASTVLGSAGSTFLGEYMQAVDIAGDDLPDVIWSGQNFLQIIEGLPGRQFAAPVNLAIPADVAPTGPISVFDANGDGFMDIAMSTEFTADETFAVALWTNDGQGGFLPAEIIEIDHPLQVTMVKDVDGDGSPDLITANTFEVIIDFSDPGQSDKLIAGAGEFSTLERTPDGGWLRTYVDGTQVTFDSAGRQTATIDTNGRTVAYAYDAQGRLSTVTDEAGGVTIFTYGAGGVLASITDPSGRVTQFAHDSEGRLVEITEPEDGTIALDYDRDGRMTSMTDQRGFTTTHDYGAAGRYVGSGYPDGSSVRMQIASAVGLDGILGGLGGPDDPLEYVAPEDRVTVLTDKRGGTSEIVLNEHGAPVQITDPVGRVITMTRDDDNLVTQLQRPTDSVETGPGGTRTDAFAYDDKANLLTWREAVGTALERETAFEYDNEFSRVTRITDPGGFETSFTYDTRGNNTVMTDAAGSTRTMDYDARGLMTRQTDFNGNATLYAYNADGNVVTIETADTSVTQIGYTGRGETSTIADAFGSPLARIRTWEYDDEGYITRRVDGLGNETLSTYDARGNRLTRTDKTGLVTTFTYDSLNRMISVDHPVDGLTTYTHDIAGKLATEEDAEGRLSQYQYDAVDRLIRAVDSDAQERLFSYDSSDNITLVTDALGQNTSYGLDILDRVLERKDPLAGTLPRVFGYDSRDNIVAMTREDGLAEQVAYDALSRRTQIVTPDNTLTFDYDAQSNMTAAADDDSAISFTYDEMNRTATATTDGTVGPQPASTLTYAYDLLDRRTSLTDHLGGTIGYGHDADDRLVRLDRPWGGSITFDYDAQGRRTAMTRDGGSASTMTYDAGGRLASLSHVLGTVPIKRYAFEYTPVGQLAVQRDLDAPAASRSYVYDIRRRLTMVAEGVPAGDGGAPVPVEDYAYDAEGNRTISHLSLLHAHDEHNRLTEDDAYTYSYDPKGNRVSRTSKAGGGTETYTYDSFNRLIGYGSVGGTIADYAYDPFGRRIAKTVTPAGGAAEATTFVYDGQDILLRYQGTGGAPTLQDRWLHGARTDEPLAFERYSGTTAPASGTVLEVHADRLGSVTDVVDPALGQVVEQSIYDSFGAILTRSGTLGQPFGFTGREFDAESGLYFYRARTYDPVAGRFLQDDPIGFAAGDTNLYAYVFNDPVNWVDPTGLLSTEPWSPPRDPKTKSRGGGGSPSMEYVGLTSATLAAQRGILSSIFNGLGILVTAINNMLSQAAMAPAGPAPGGGANSGGGGDNDECDPATDPDGCEEKPDCDEPLQRGENLARKIQGDIERMVVDEHELYDYHRDLDEAHPVFGSWVGHQINTRRTQNELGSVINELLSLDCEVPGHFYEMRDEDLPRQPGYY
ncbi:MAG: PKD domain-containing protein [Pseudomonadota bacterium]